MTAEILSVVTGLSVVRCAGGCGRTVHPRTPGNDPAYCSYKCALVGQPQYAKATMRNSSGVNEPA